MILRKINRKNAFRVLLNVLFVTGIYSCVEEIDSISGEYKNLLVVEGLVSDENTPYTISLTRSMEDYYKTNEPVEQAIVSVNDDLGNENRFAESKPGIYTSNPNEFIGVVGRSYRLAIKTKEGEEYLSEWCYLNEPTQIDSIYYDVADYYSKDWDRDLKGIQLYIDGMGHSSDKDHCFIRWTYEENWKFNARYQRSFIIEDPDSVVNIPIEKYYCWKSEESRSLLYQSFQNRNDAIIRGQKLLFVQAPETDRFSIRYSINVKQYTISEDEYLFLDKMNAGINNTGGFFDSQPFSVTGNIYNVKNNNEPVLGYFHVNSVVSRRLYINAVDISNLGIVIFEEDDGCSVENVTLDGNWYTSLYSAYKALLSNGKVPVGLDGQPSGDEWEWTGLKVVPTNCTDCTVYGTETPPSFWEDE